MSEEPANFEATVRPRRRWSSVWVIPIVALAVAGWLVWKHYSERGPLAEVRFDTASSVRAGETEIRCRSVRVGMVETVSLAKDLDSVVVGIRIAPASTALLREDSRFWVVRPRVSASNISGLGTLISGAYIELEPGRGAAGARSFKGLEKPPVTASNIPGLRLTLVAAEAGSLAIGAPIHYRGFEVGQVETRTLDPAANNIRFDIFIHEEHAALVRTGTRFWNTSGIDVSAGVDGFKLRTPSLQAMLSGGATFSVPLGQDRGEPAADGTVFTLYEDETAARDASFVADRRALLFFDQSVRGLSRGAPVEFRGMPLGRVVDISFSHALPGDSRVPVLIEFDSATLRHATASEADGTLRLAEAVERGLRAKLGTGSLLTGALFIDLDFAADAAPAELGRHDDIDIIPTQSSGLAQLEDQINAVLAKLQALPLDDTLVKFGRAAEETSATLADARETFSAVEATLTEIRGILAAEATQSLTAEISATLTELRSAVESLGPGGAVQGDLRRALDEMRSTLRSFKTLSDTVEEKPNSLLFGRESSGNPIPRARKR